MRRCIVEESVKKSVANVFVPTYFAERVGVSVTCYGYVYNIHTFTPFISYITCTHGFVLKKKSIDDIYVAIVNITFCFFPFSMRCTCIDLRSSYSPKHPLLYSIYTCIHMFTGVEIVTRF